MRADLVEMVETSFSSVWSLELLLVLCRDPKRNWTPEQLVGELRSSDLVVAQSIDGLLAAGLALSDAGGTVRYGPASRHQDELVRELELEYRVKPASIRRLIIRNPDEKLRSFANAFNLKKS